MDTLSYHDFRGFIEEAKRVTKEMTKEPPVPDEKTFTPPEVTIKREEI